MIHQPNSLAHSKMAELPSLRGAEVGIVSCAHAQGFPHWCESPGGTEAACAGVSIARPLLSDSGTFQHVSPDDSSGRAESAA